MTDDTKSETPRPNTRLCEIPRLGWKLPRLLIFQSTIHHPSLRWPTSAHQIEIQIQIAHTKLKSKFKSLTPNSYRSYQIQIAHKYSDRSHQIQIAHTKFKSLTLNSNRLYQITVAPQCTGLSPVPLLFFLRLARAAFLFSATKAKQHSFG